MRFRRLAWAVFRGRGEDNHCWFCRTGLPPRKRNLCYRWCLRRLIDGVYHARYPERLFY